MKNSTKLVERTDALEARLPPKRLRPDDNGLENVLKFSSSKTKTMSANIACP